ncbi:YibE/F family protein [Actinoplanes bogorensis]|uniref:YibE/F family protein n=1 Tax=Paractinoplanes bogorensis TaxID=1610840 RepID=A0ABS5YIW0_9ACTN|nr:YibE/F family protein [Actinoplanes bogorensis]MBU2663414.1 YibE/F family protein [Actinoplanes bogorensis]
MNRRTRLIVTAVLVPAAVATLIAMLVMWPGRVELSNTDPGGERVKGTVTAVTTQKATVRVDNGPETTVDLPQGPGAIKVAPGDDIVLLYFPGAVPGGSDYTIVDHQRGGPLIWMLALTVAVILVFGRWRGLTSLVGLAISFGVLLFFIIPAILDGSPPLLVAVVGSSAIMFAALYLTHGVDVHTSVAVAGTLASLIVTGVLGVAFTATLHLTGIANDDDSFLAVTQGSIDMRGLLLAGIIIGALGVLDDVTVTQATTVAELAQTGGHTRWSLYRAAIRIGRAHVASAVNTIVLAYAGASLPLLLLIAAGPQPVGDLLTSEFLGQEILRSAVGTIGLVASVPITTALATLVAEIPAPGRHRFI